ncbi:hypothetical protein [Salinibacter sp. 10B]|uniref:hypothetical protein n=1 Tax=Salinibacter sp. 10B TaxID=1923971 RepID=UPI000CF45F8F|nr:hypothetical protein [Salinibacter sp. 10B]
MSSTLPAEYTPIEEYAIIGDCASAALVEMNGSIDWQWATWWLGALLGTFHGLFILIVIMPALPDVHPRMAGKHHGPTPTRQLEPPGFMALNYGRNTPAITLIAHAVYGILLGAFY